MRLRADSVCCLHTQLKNKRRRLLPYAYHGLSYTVFFAKYRFSSSTVINGRRVALQTLSSRLAIFFRSVLTPILSISAAASTVTANFSGFTTG